MSKLSDLRKQTPLNTTPLFIGGFAFLVTTPITFILANAGVGSAGLGGVEFGMLAGAAGAGFEAGAVGIPEGAALLGMFVLFLAALQPSIVRFLSSPAGRIPALCCSALFLLVPLVGHFAFPNGWLAVDVPGSDVLSGAATSEGGSGNEGGGGDGSPMAYVLVGANVLYGVALAYLVLLWGNLSSMFFASRGKEALDKALLTSFGFAAAICFLSLFLQKGFLQVAAPFAPVFSLVAAAVLTSVEDKAGGAEGSDFRDMGAQMPLRHAFYPILLGSCCGFLYCHVARIAGAESSAAVLLAAASCAVVSHTVVAKVLGRSLNFHAVERVVFPVAFLGMAVSPLAGQGPFALVVLFAGGFAFVLFLCSHWLLMVKWAQRWHSQPLHHFAYGAFTIAGGLAFGIGLSLGGSFVGLPSDLVACAVALLLMFVVVVIISAFPYGTFFEFDELDVASEGAESRGIWRTAIELLAQEHALTPREREVALPLSRGRSVRRIGEELHVSEHTVKTHVYHIYQKTGSKDLQAFIDLVEKKADQVRASREHVL